MMEKTEMSETWHDLSDAPIGVPVSVWCNILNGPPGNEREWKAVQEFKGWWSLLGKKTRIHPTHWRPLPSPPSQTTNNDNGEE